MMKLTNRCPGNNGHHTWFHNAFVFLSFSNIRIMKLITYLGVMAVLAGLTGCGEEGEKEKPVASQEKKDAAAVRLITLDPGHFHAALVQKTMYPGIDPVVHVYAPEGPEVTAHLALID